MINKPFGKDNPYNNRRKSTSKEREQILSTIKDKKYESSGTDAIRVGDRIFTIDHSADSELEENLEKGDGFGIRKRYNLTKLKEEDVREIVRNIASTYSNSEESIRRVLQNIGIGQRQLFSLNIDAAIRGGIRDSNSMDAQRGGQREQALNNGSSSNSRENKGLLSGGTKEINFLKTSLGEVLGFVYKGEIYLDETKISPEAPLHEYTHIWDAAVSKSNPQLWARGIQLMKQVDLWNQIANSDSYGKLWKSQGITGNDLINHIASIIHPILDGTISKKRHLNKLH